MTAFDHDIIVAPATATGGALAVIRVSGDGAIECCDRVFRAKQQLADMPARTFTYGQIIDGEHVIDDVIASIYRAPHSYTGEDSVEFSAHGSKIVVSEIVALLCREGARMAKAGEFSLRAFAAGKIDLSQAEATADIIASDSKAALAVASTQMRGGYSAELRRMREQLVDIASLVELELDFSEEDVEFADRDRLVRLLTTTDTEVMRLMESFRTGNAIREGVRVAIVGEPNVGKSTLLNRLVGDDRAMVSAIAGTTRDTIEATTVIDGIKFRFIDTAGLHSTDDELERMGIERTHKAIESAQIVMHVISAEEQTFVPIEHTAEQQYMVVANKVDRISKLQHCDDRLYVSALTGEGFDSLSKALISFIDIDAVQRGETIVSNMRHFDALVRTHRAIAAALEGIGNSLPTDLLTEDIREALSSLGEITGAVTSDTILQRIFSTFCIGK